MYDHKYHIDQVDPVPQSEQSGLFKCCVWCGLTMIELTLEPDAARDLYHMLKSWGVPY